MDGARKSVRTEPFDDAQDRPVEALLKDATEQDWSEEYLAPIISIKVVADVDEAIAHINRDTTVYRLKKWMGLA